MPGVDGGASSGPFAARFGDAGRSAMAVSGAGGSLAGGAAGEPDAGAGPDPGPAGAIVLEPGGSHAGSPELQPSIDRLVHHSVILEFNGPSIRAEEAKKRNPKAQPQPSP